MYPPLGYLAIISVPYVAVHRFLSRRRVQRGLVLGPQGAGGGPPRRYAVPLPAQLELNTLTHPSVTL